MKKIQCSIYIVSFILILIFVYAVFSFPEMMQRAFKRDSDYHWVHDCTKFYIVQKKQFPENWNELLSFSNEHMYQPIDGITDRVEINFRLFTELNQNNCTMDIMNESSIWIFRWADNKRGIHQDRLAEYFNVLKLNRCPDKQKL